MNAILWLDHLLWFSLEPVTMLLLTGKGVFISILAGIFLGYFGYPSYVKYQKHDTVFTESRVKFDPQKNSGNQNLCIARDSVKLLEEQWRFGSVFK